MTLNEYRHKMRLIVEARKNHGIHSLKNASTLAQNTAQEMIEFKKPTFNPCVGRSVYALAS